MAAAAELSQTPLPAPAPAPAAPAAAPTPASAAAAAPPKPAKAYRDMWVFCESKDGKFLPVSLEMLGEARRLMDKYNRDYGREEKVVGVVLGQNAEALAQQAARSGADVVYWADHADLSHFRIEPYTHVVAAMALDKARTGCDKPRYFLYPATHNGRDLSATVCAVLEAGCASDCNKLYIENVPMKHPLKTGGVEKTIEAVLHMKRPDFSGFEWSTILCLDDIYNDWKPESCSVIPGSMKPLEQPTAPGKVVKVEPKLDAKALRVQVKGRRKFGGGIDLGKYDVVVSLGRGIGRDPSKGIKLGLDLARAMGGEVGISRGVVTAKYKVEAGLLPYVAEERQIGETGQMVKPKLYIALGISGAIQHKKGMDQSNVIVAVNTDPNVPIKEFSDVFIHGDLYEVVPRLLEELKAQGVVRAPLAQAGGR
jgi:electron transfer flavoprotein alpha subunit